MTYKDSPHQEQNPTKFLCHSKPEQDETFLSPEVGNLISFLSPHKPSEAIKQNR